jgi:hypothetical protein
VGVTQTRETNVKKIFIIAALALASTSAQADTQTSTHCSWSRHGASCVTSRQIIEPPAPPTAEEIQARIRNEREWEAFCKPTRTIDSMGMTRLVYAKAGCEFGRTK